ncbi:MAG TPA: TlpA disulfide reductase family protein [Anaeromyxobacteraceae bacterium]|nr:TlpA disulfide reductase family protein [Anaeromyxobacteraceae bacterium]
MKSWLKLGLVIAVAVGSSAFFHHRHHRTFRQAAGIAAPPLALLDTGGRQISLEALRGKVVAINFWATWCGPCQQEIPLLAKVYAANKGKCFEMLGVAEESGAREEVMWAAHKLGVNYPVLVDEDGKVGDAFKIPGYPRTFLIDVDGRIRRVFDGEIERGELESALAPLLAEAPASCPRA